MVREAYGNGSSSMEMSMNSGGGGGGSGGGGGNHNMMMMMKPAWLEGLMAETFFGGCGAHENRRKNEKNVFCLHCCLSICPHCLSSHRSHPLLQVRRYVYHDVVRLGDLEKLIECSYIQPYTINGAKVIFLNQRPQSRTCNNKQGSANFCLTCDRILQDPFHFCSLSCKVNHMVYQGEDLSGILYRFDESDFTISQFEGLRMDGSEVIDDDGHMMMPSSIIEDPLQYQVAASSCSNEATSHDSVMLREPDVIKKKKKKKSGGSGSGSGSGSGGGSGGGGFLPGIVLSLSSRRKGAPQRAPLS